MMQEYVEEKAVALVMRGTKLTGRMLARAIQAFLKKERAPAAKHDTEQTVKSLLKDGADLPSIEITDDNIGTFKRTARKHNIDFELKRDGSVEPPKWFVYFKAKDADALTAAFNEYSKTALKEVNRKPSMLAKLDKFNELARSVSAPVKNRNIAEREI